MVVEPHCRPMMASSVSVSQDAEEDEGGGGGGGGGGKSVPPVPPSGRAPLKTILLNFLNHVSDLEARKSEGENTYEKEFQVSVRKT